MENNLAVLIDFENIAAGTEKEGLGRFDIDALMARAKDKGRILVARSYADWGRFARFKQSLLANNVTMYELTSHGMQDKNRADIAMVVDCLELAFTRDYVDTYIVVSGDSDFTPLVLKLRELQKRVIGIGTKRSTSRLLINACDEFIFYDSIVGAKQQQKKRRRKRPTNVNKDVEKAIELLTDALEGLMREDPTPPLASIVKTAMLRKQPDFSESDLGFGSFTRFLEAAKDAGAVRLVKDQKSGTWAVDSVDDDSDDSSEAPAKSSGSKPKKASGSGAYDDPYYPEGSIGLVDALHAAGIGPMAFPTRMAVLEQLVEVVGPGSKRRRASTPVVADQLKQRLRRTHPELDKPYLEAFLKGLREADLLMHKDGTPIRRGSAAFKVDKDAAGLNRALAEHYVKVLRKGGVDVSDAPRLAALLLGDADRAREIEEIVAWSVATPSEAPSDDDQPTEAGVDLDDLDAILDLDDADVESIDDDADDAAEAKDTKAKAKDAEPKDEDAAAPAEDAPEAKPAPKKKSTRSRSRKKKADAPEADAKAEEPKAEEPKAEEPKAEEPKAEEPKADATEEAEAEAAPKKPTRRRSTKKKAAPKAEDTPKADDDDDLDGLLEVDE